MAALPWRDVVTGKITDLRAMVSRCESDPVLQRRFAPLLKTALDAYPQFLSFWHQQIGPGTRPMVGTYLTQWDGADIIAVYEWLTRLDYRCGDIDVWISPFFPTASNFSTPLGTLVCGPTPSNMSLSWLLGHELTHPQITHEGWRQTEDARYFYARDLDVEEALCLCLQNQVALACGQTERRQRMPDRGYFRVTNLLKARWDYYLANRERYPTILNFLSEAGRDALEADSVEIHDERLASRFQALVAALKAPTSEQFLALYRPKQQNDEQRRKQVDLWLALFGSPSFGVQEAVIEGASLDGDKATITATLQYKRRIGPKYGQGWLREFETTRWAIHDGEWHFVGFSKYEDEIMDFDLWEPRDTSGMSARDVAVEFAQAMADEQNLNRGLALIEGLADGSPKGAAKGLVWRHRMGRDLGSFKRLFTGEIGEPEPAIWNGREVPNMATVPVRSKRGTHKLWLRKASQGYKVTGGF